MYVYEALERTLKIYSKICNEIGFLCFCMCVCGFKLFVVFVRSLIGKSEHTSFDEEIQQEKISYMKYSAIPDVSSVSSELTMRSFLDLIEEKEEREEKSDDEESDDEEESDEEERRDDIVEQLMKKMEEQGKALETLTAKLSLMMNQQEQEENDDEDDGEDERTFSIDSLSTLNNTNHEGVSRKKPFPLEEEGEGEEGLDKTLSPPLTRTRQKHTYYHTDRSTSRSSPPSLSFTASYTPPPFSRPTSRRLSLDPSLPSSLPRSSTTEGNALLRSNYRYGEWLDCARELRREGEEDMAQFRTFQAKRYAWNEHGEN